MSRPPEKKGDGPEGLSPRLSGSIKQFFQIDFSPEDAAVQQLTPRERLRTWCNDVLAGVGKIAGAVAVARVAEAYGAMTTVEERDEFYRLLLEEFPVDALEVEEAIDTYLEAPGSRVRALIQLTEALDSQRVKLLRQFNAVPEGLKFLIDLRADVSRRIREHPDLTLLAYELRHLLESWLNVGFLRLERITWASSAALLEKLVEYEAVHAIESWVDLKRRLQADRVCFAYIHPNMPVEPVIFMEVALVQGIAERIEDLIDPGTPVLEPQAADTAVFYSITNAQRGLRGIKFGNMLIKQVVARLRSELPNLTTFATLSPVPRFREDYLDPAVKDGSIARHIGDEEGRQLCDVADAEEVPAAVDRILSRPDWHLDATCSDVLRPGLIRAMRHYLTEVQRRERVACPVGHFHASNGAKLGRINWLGNTSAEGVAQSAGMMANYVYELRMFDHYQAEYSRTGRMPMEAAMKLI